MWSSMKPDPLGKQVPAKEEELRGKVEWLRNHRSMHVGGAVEMVLTSGIPRRCLRRLAMAKGHLYPPTATPPVGAAKLRRYYDEVRADWLLLLESEEAPPGYDDTIFSSGGAPTGDLRRRLRER